VAPAPPPGVPAPPPAVTTTLTAAVTKGAEVLEVANTVGMLPNSKVVIKDPETGAYETNIIKAIGSITLMQPTVNAYGVSSTVSMFLQDAGKVTSIAAITTGSGLITAMVPQYVSNATTTKVKLTGNVSVGDLVQFADKVSKGGSCNTTAPDLVVSALKEVEVPGIAKEGVYVMCYRQAGKSDSVVQTNVQLTVQSTPYPITAVSATPSFTPTTIVEGGAQKPTLIGTTSEGDSIAWVLHGELCDPLDSVRDWKPVTAGEDQVASVTPTEIGEWDLCFRTKANQDDEEQATKQLGASLVVRAFATCGDSDGSGPNETRFTCPINNIASDTKLLLTCASYLCDEASTADQDQCCVKKDQCNTKEATTEADCKAAGNATFNNANSFEYCAGEACNVAENAADKALCCTTSTASTDRLYSVLDNTATTSQGSSNTVMMGAGFLLLVSFVVVGFKKMKSDARGMALSQDDEFSSLEEALE